MRYHHRVRLAWLLIVAVLLVSLSLPVLAYASSGEPRWQALLTGAGWRESSGAAVVDVVAPWVAGSSANANSQVLSGWAWAAIEPNDATLYIPLLLKDG